MGVAREAGGRVWARGYAGGGGGVASNGGGERGGREGMLMRGGGAGNGVAREVGEREAARQEAGGAIRNPEKWSRSWSNPPTPRQPRARRGFMNRRGGGVAREVGRGGQRGPEEAAAGCGSGRQERRRRGVVAKGRAAESRRGGGGGRDGRQAMRRWGAGKAAAGCAGGAGGRGRACRRDGGKQGGNATSALTWRQPGFPASGAEADGRLQGGRGQERQRRDVLVGQGGGEGVAGEIKSGEQVAGHAAEKNRRGENATPALARRGFASGAETGGRPWGGGQDRQRRHALVKMPRQRRPGILPTGQRQQARLIPTPELIRLTEKVNTAGSGPQHHRGLSTAATSASTPLRPRPRHRAGISTVAVSTTAPHWHRHRCGLGIGIALDIDTTLASALLWPRHWHCIDTGIASAPAGYYPSATPVKSPGATSGQPTAPMASTKGIVAMIAGVAMVFRYAVETGGGVTTAALHCGVGEHRHRRGLGTGTASTSPWPWHQHRINAAVASAPTRVNTAVASAPLRTQYRHDLNTATAPALP
ncbi:hypothetical protein BD779DRAFT_1473055 [Infundibulicybe gibba]|nr:hypothetical protein BD779DRAFT_1473055 [Infundibulicybe gibba]